jgi:predicted nucleic acid-binding protein
MTRSVLADTGPLYAVADDGDAHHKRALRELAALARERREIVIAYPILLEAYSLILFRMGRKAASLWLSQVTSAAFVDTTPHDYRQAIAHVQSLPDQSLTLVDATIAAMANRLKLPVWTYDHHFDMMRANVWR